MKITRITFLLFFFLCLVPTSYGATPEGIAKPRILVVSSYHREYLWSIETNKGFCAAMLKFGYLDDQDQADEYTRNDSVESSKAIIKKLWMDVKRKSGNKEMASSAMEITRLALEFKPDIMLMGDDDAVQYIGGQFLDSKIPVVFWGVNYTPVKYGLVDSAEAPGHNVTGIYQTGYYAESLDFLKKIVPGVKTFAVLSDASSAGRTHAKAIEYLDRTGALPCKLIEPVSTKDYEAWKEKALELQAKADAFFVAQYNSLQDNAGKPVPAEEVMRWYGTHITIPEASLGAWVKDGLLCAADDSGYNQGFEAVEIANDILANGASPATYPPRAPKRGALMVNTKRAAALGIKLTPEMGIEEYINGSVTAQ